MFFEMPKTVICTLLPCPFAPELTIQNYSYHSREKCMTANYQVAIFLTICRIFGEKTKRENWKFITLRNENVEL